MDEDRSSHIDDDRAIALALDELENKNSYLELLYETPDNIEGCNALNFDKTLRFDNAISQMFKSKKLTTPRVNSKQLPTEEVVFTDREALKLKIATFGLKEKEILGNGDCQFSALSDQLYRTPEHSNKDYGEYVRKMERKGEWGDHVTLQAAADYFGVRIWILTSYENSSFIEIEPLCKKSERILFLSFWAEVHYNSLYPSWENIPEKEKWKFCK